VDQRRAKVHVHNARREIDRLLANLTDCTRRVEGKGPTSQDFADARAASVALRRSVNEARSFAKEDQKFTAYITEVEANLTRQENAIDERWAQLSAEKQRMLLEESRLALAASIAKINKDASDAQFDAADRAASALSKRLEEGRVLEAKDKTYRSNAERARAELVQATQHMAKLLSEAGLARVKSEVEPAFKDLAAAGQALRGKNPTVDQVAEARTAAIVVRKLIEKFQPQASRSQEIGQYVSEVKKTLVEVEVELQRRNLDSAKADLVTALKSVERRAATDEDFEKVKTALGSLEKTLQTIHTKEPALAKPIADARTLLASAPTTIAKRRLVIDVQRQRAKVDEAKRNAAALINEIQTTEGGDEQLRAAENGVKQLNVVLDEGVPLTKKDGEYASYVREVKKRVLELNERIAKRRVAIAVREGRTLLSETITRAKKELEAAQRPDAKDPDIDSAAQSVEALNQAIKARTSLEKQDKGYAAQADRSRDQLMRLGEALELARQARDLRRKTVETLAMGASAVESAAAAQDLRTQKDYYEKALAQFRACADEGASLIKTNGALERVAVVMEGRPTTPKDVIGVCAQRTEVTAKILDQLKGRIRFEEGAKRAFERGKALVAQTKKSEAASQFGECFVEGMIVQNQHPELKDSVFEVAGMRMTLAALIQECARQKKLIERK
jgi:hypothetical protein